MEMLDALKRSGLRITEGRRVVVEVLEEFLNRGEHPTFNMIVNEVKSRRPSTSVSTIYSTLRALESSGAISSFKIGNETVYDRPQPHVNVVCIDSNEVSDVDVVNLQEFVRELGERGFDVKNIVVYARCKSSEGRPTRPQ